MVDRSELLVRRDAVYAGRSNMRVGLADQAGGAHHVELVEVACRGRQKAQPFEQRMVGVSCLSKNPATEGQPGELAVDEALRTVPHHGRCCRRVGQPGGAESPSDTAGEGAGARSCSFWVMALPSSGASATLPWQNIMGLRRWGDARITSRGHRIGRGGVHPQGCPVSPPSSSKPRSSGMVTARPPARAAASASATSRRAASKERSMRGSR